MLKVSRSCYYRFLAPPVPKRAEHEKEVLQKLIYWHEKYPVWGLDSLLKKVRDDVICSRKLLYRLMKENCIRSTRKRHFHCTTNSRHSLPLAPNLLNGKTSFTKQNAAWVADITYIPTDEGWLYLAMVKDLFTKQVVGYAMSSRIDSRLVIDSFLMAVHREKPSKGLVFHSDRGSQYASLKASCPKSIPRNFT